MQISRARPSLTGSRGPLREAVSKDEAERHCAKEDVRVKAPKRFTIKVAVSVNLVGILYASTGYPL